MEEKFRFNIKSLKDRRRELRSNQTEFEKILWNSIRGRKLNGFKFHRQYSIGPYIVDFYCPFIRLAIEIDGEHHTKTDIYYYDKERSEYLKSAGIQVVRFMNNEIIDNVDQVLDKICIEINRIKSI